MTTLPSIPNLVTTNVTFVCPWDFQSPIPDGVKGKENKKHRGAWIENPDTLHNCYSGWEGFDQHVRISSARDGNAPYKLHALVGDYDAAITEDELVKGCERLGDHLPAYFERTLSGFARFVWLLEKPVTVPSREFAVALLKFLSQRLLVDKLAVGLDTPAWLSPERYYTNSCDWAKVSDYRIPASLMTGWVMQVAEKFSFRNSPGSTIAIPLPKVWEELTKKYPAATWPGDFVEGSQGPSFFVEGSVSPRSALVKAEGIYTFAAHAVKPWWGWADLLGKAFVEDYETKSLGDAVEGIFFDGKSYWRRDGNGKWLAYNKEDTGAHLDIHKGLSRTSSRGAPSEVDRALEHIRHWNGVVGAAPFVFRPHGLLRIGDQRVLNTFTRRVTTPAPGPVTWGPKGEMPFLSEFLGGFFDPPEQLDYFLSALSRFYRSAHELRLESGQNIFIVGPADIGKTLFSTVVLSKLMGGHAVAEDYLMGNTSFNSQLFEVALWTIDDNAATVDSVTHRKFSTIIKRMAANTTFEYHAKFQVPCQVKWQGRVFVTMNADEESIQLIPNLDISILDKIFIFKAAHRDIKFPPQRELEATIDREVAYLARFLLDFETPEKCRGRTRFGVVSYHEPSLVQVAKHSSRSNAFLEVLEDWKKDYFAEHDEDWKGSSHQLLVAFNRDAAKAAALRSMTTTVVARGLAALKNSGYVIYNEETSLGRLWVIPAPKRPFSSPAKTQNSSRFAK